MPPPCPTAAGDNRNHRVRLLHPDGSVTTLAGDGNPGDADGVGSNAQFNRPVGITHYNGSFFISDNHNHRIRKLEHDGTVTTVAGSGVRGFADGVGAAAQFDCPFGISVDEKGTAVIADLGNDRLRTLNLSTGEVATLAPRNRAAEDHGGGGGSAAPESLQGMTFARPYVCTVTSEGKVLVAEMGRRQIKMVASDVLSPLSTSSQISKSGGGSASDDGHAAALHGSSANAAGSKLLHDLLRTGSHADVTFLLADQPASKEGTSSSGAARPTPPGASVTAHRSILTLRSSYFEAMFADASFVEANGIIRLPEGITIQAVRATLQFIYTDNGGLARFNSDELEDILRLAQQWLLDELVEECCNVFVSRLEPASCVNTALLADALGGGGAAHASIDTMRANAVAFASQTFLQIPPNDAERIATTNPMLLVEMLRVLSAQHAPHPHPQHQYPQQQQQSRTSP